MATLLYGEIKPVISRAVDEDDDEDVPLRSRPLLVEWCGERADQEQIKADTLLVFVGETATCFFHAYFKSDETDLIGILKKTRDDDEDRIETVSKQNDKVSSIYKSSNSDISTVMITCNSYITSENIWSWTLQVFENVKVDRDVVVLTSASFQEFKCEDPSSFSVPFVRSLSTSQKPESHPVFPALEQPNMIKNIPAAMMSYSEIHHIPAVVYICFTETFKLDSSSVQAFIELLKTPQFSSLSATDEQESKKYIINRVKMLGTGDSLYM